MNKMASNHQTSLVLATAGFTKSGKTAMASLLESYADFRRFELSQVIWDSLEVDPANLSPDKVFAEIDHQRCKYGEDVLGHRIADAVKRNGCTRAVIAGLRSSADAEALNQHFPNLIIIFVHATTYLRHKYLRNDPHSLLKTKADFRKADRQGFAEGISLVARRARYVIVNEPGHAITPIEQLAEIVAAISGEHKESNIRWAESIWPELGEGESLSNGVRLFRNLDPALGLQLAKQGKIRQLISIPDSIAEEILVLPAIFHQVAQEVTVVTSGRVLCIARRGASTGEESTYTVLTPGEAVTILPGWARTYVAMSDSASVVSAFRPTRMPVEMSVADTVDIATNRLTY
jgi:hypothetical protein